MQTKEIVSPSLINTVDRCELKQLNFDSQMAIPANCGNIDDMLEQVLERKDD